MSVFVAMNPTTSLGQDCQPRPLMKEASMSKLVRFGVKRISVAIGVLAVVPCAAQSIEVNLGPPEFRSLVVETVYPFKLQKYAPVLAIAKVQARATLRATPEQTLSEMVSSIAAGDFEWNSSLWDPKSRASMAERDRQDGHGPEYWLSQWKPHAKAAYRLLHRIEYGKYVLIEYERSDAGRQSKSTIALLAHQGQWYLTQEIASEAILSSWNAPENRVRVVPDGMIRR
jgi:hypothetical protein